MSREDAIKKAIARAMNPKIFNPTSMQKRVAGRDDPANEYIERARWDDIVAAFAGCSEIGRIMFRLKYAGEAPTVELLERAAAQLAERMNRGGVYGRRSPSPMYVSMCRQAFIEWLHDECPRCTRSRLWTGDGKVVCDTCAGVGRIPLSEAIRRGKCRNEIALMEDGRIPKVMRLRCPDCRGAGRVALDAEAMKETEGACPICRGSHERALTNLQRAIQLGMGVETFTEKSWASKYEACLATLREIDAESVTTVDSGLRLRHTRAESSSRPEYQQSAPGMSR